MKKWLFLSLLLLLLLVACNAEEESTNDVETDPKTEEASSEVTEPASQSDTATEDSENNELTVNVMEQYIDGLVNWKSFEMYTDLTEEYSSEELIDSEFHQEIKYVMEPVQVYRSAHSISFANLHVEEYATATEGFRSEDMEEWMPFDDTEQALMNPIDARMSLLNTIISSSGNVLANSFEYHHEIDAENQQTVMNEAYMAIYGIPFDDTLELTKVKVVVTVLKERLEKFSITATANVEGSSDIVEIKIEERYDRINEFTEVEVPEGVTATQ